MKFYFELQMEVVAKAEIWRHWWLLTHGKSYSAGDSEMEKLVALRDAAESDLEQAVAALTATPKGKHGSS